MPFVDFEEVKRTVSFGQAIALLKLDMKHHGQQWRGPCPACKSGGDRALVVTEGKGAYCFAEGAGGDQIWLAAHILGKSVKDAAAFLSQTTQQTVPSTVPQKEAPSEGLQPLTHLEADHPATVAIGFDIETAKRYGIGYAPKGIMRGTVAIPLRDESGTLVAYIGVEDARLPASLMGNVVQLKKPA